MTQQSCNISDCFIAKQWEIKEPEECLACDDDGNCGYKIVGDKGYKVV